MFAAGATTFPLSRSAASACLRHRVSCQRTQGSEPQQQAPGQPMLHRRNLLVGLGGLYGAAARPPVALATPVMPPDLAKCHRSEAAARRECCPPFTGNEEITDYDFPATPLRVRRPAHEVIHDEDYIRKYTLAVQRMKALPDDDPWNFFQQANVHCQYCNAAYAQAGEPGVPLQIHHSWLFLPWHRYYLHFYERILGKLIGDDTFTIPFWNFDHPQGMTFPRLFDAPSSPLYDPKRDPEHVKDGALLDYRYAYANPSGGAGGDSGEAERLVMDNLDYMRKTFRQSLAVPELFMGDPLRAGEVAAKSSSGQLEVIHNAVHMWVGPPESNECPPDVPYTKCHVNMGDLSTAARDSVFFSIHNNVDRLWDIYHNLRGNRLEFDDRDWLDSTFLFTDENRRLVRVKVVDCLSTHKLCYTFEQVHIPWLGKLSKPMTVKGANKAVLTTHVDVLGTQPRKLDAQTPLRVLVARPKTSRRKAEKEDAEEVLQIEGIEASLADIARFDVYVAAPYGSNLADPADLGEFAGSFLRLAHAVKGGGDHAPGMTRTKLKLGLNALLEDIEAEGAEKVVVTLVLRTGDISVGGIAIKLQETDNSAFV